MGDDDEDDDDGDDDDDDDEDDDVLSGCGGRSPASQAGVERPATVSS